jgi:LysM repeat protein
VRFLAPLALIAVVVAFVTIINGSGGSGSGSSTTTTSSTAKSTTKSSKPAAKQKAVKKKAATKTYTVQAGDSFGTIAAKTGITVAQLQALNPTADSTQLQTGQKLRVK